MEPFPPPPNLDFLLDLPSLRLLAALTLVVQALVVVIHFRSVTRFPGMGAFVAASLVLAGWSAAQVAQPVLSPLVGGIGSGVLVLAGTALQYASLARFTGRNPSKGLLWGLGLGGALLLLLVGLVGRGPVGPLRELLIVPLLVATALVFRRGVAKDYRAGAILTAVPFAGYAVLSVARFLLSLADPSVDRPGPSWYSQIDAVGYFLLSFLWTSGFLLMVNQKLHAEVRRMAILDPLTGCLNRRAIDERLGAAQGNFDRYGRPYAVVLIDFDRFKAINDELGHPAGDRVLVEGSAVLARGLRTGDALARWGGEEFLVLLPENDQTQAAALAERLRSTLADHDFGLGRRVTLSAGVAGPATGRDLAHVLKRADDAMYQAKRTRNAVAVDPS